MIIGVVVLVAVSLKKEPTNVLINVEYLKAHKVKIVSAWRLMAREADVTYIDLADQLGGHTYQVSHSGQNPNRTIYIYIDRDRETGQLFKEGDKVYDYFWMLCARMAFDLSRKTVVTENEKQLLGTLRSYVVGLGISDMKEWPPEWKM